MRRGACRGGTVQNSGAIDENEATARHESSPSIWEASGKGTGERKNKVGRKAFSRGREGKNESHKSKQWSRSRGQTCRPPPSHTSSATAQEDIDAIRASQIGSTSRSSSKATRCDCPQEYTERVFANLKVIAHEYR